MRILVATDLSPRSDWAIARGYALAAALKAELTILNVVDADLPDELRNHSLEWARDALAREILTRDISQTRIKARAEVFAGHARTDIARHADAIKADFILIGIHNTAVQPTPPTFAATTAGQILKSTRLPVLLVRQEADRPYGKVVIGVDFSVYSRAALRAAIEVARGAHFHLVHAFHIPFKGFMPSEENATEVALDQRLAFDAFLGEEMELLAKRGQEDSIAPANITKIVREGEPHHLLPSECAKIGADLLVIGTHGRTGVSAAIWGSVAADILNNPPTDVLVVRAV